MTRKQMRANKLFWQLEGNARATLRSEHPVMLQESEDKVRYSVRCAIYSELHEIEVDTINAVIDGHPDWDMLTVWKPFIYDFDGGDVANDNLLLEKCVCV